MNKKAKLILLVFLLVTLIFMVFNFFSKKAVPAISSETFKTQEDKELFQKYVSEYLSSKGANEISFEGEFVVVKELASGKLGLTNVAQTCLQEDKSKWPEIIANHLTKTLSSLKEGEAVEKSLKDFSQTKDKLRVQLYPETFLSQLNDEFKKEVIYKVDLPGTISVLMVDLPSSIQTARRSDAVEWKKSEEDQFAVGLINTLNASNVEITKQLLGDTEMIAITGGDILTAVNIFNLKKYPDCTGKHGSIIAIPHRHAILCLPINDFSATKVIHMMGQITFGMNQEGPGSLSPLLYWYKDGIFENEPYAINEKKFEFYPTERFTEELNSIK